MLDSSAAPPDHPATAGNRFSFLAAGPARVLRGNLFHDQDFGTLRNAYRSRLGDAESMPDTGYPRGGLYGWVGYDGEFVFGEYDDSFVYDHGREDWAAGVEIDFPVGPPESEGAGAAILAPPRSKMGKADFCELVDRARDYIAAGDIYQVNLSHRFDARVEDAGDVFPLYRKLRERSPAPYSAYLDLDGIEVLSSSPEEFLSISGRTIRTRPIKGTRPRFRDRERDEKSAYDLITSPKEVAELIMITDLERNDLGQICEFGSIEATDLLKLERYAQVFHLVSTVEGTLRPDIDAVSAFRACFPGGSITGAPKRRAGEIITELEPTPRGVYTGAIGCFGFNGEARFNIAIRTAVRERERLHFHVGAGIVADSDPEKEWEETLHKASGLLHAFGG